MSNRTAIVWIDGDRFRFTGEQVDRMLEIGAESDTTGEAWENLRAYGEQIDA